MADSHKKTIIYGLLLSRFISFYFLLWFLFVTCCRKVSLCSIYVDLYHNLFHQISEIINFSFCSDSFVQLCSCSYIYPFISTYILPPIWVLSPSSTFHILFILRDQVLSKYTKLFYEKKISVWLLWVKDYNCINIKKNDYNLNLYKEYQDHCYTS